MEEYSLFSALRFCTLAETGTFESDDYARTKVSFAEKTFISNAFMRLVAHLFIDIDESMDLYLKDLRNALGENNEGKRDCVAAEFHRE